MYLPTDIDETVPDFIYGKTPPQKQFRFVEWQTWPFDKPQPPYGYCKGINEWSEFVDLREVVEYFGMLVSYREINVDI